MNAEEAEMAVGKIRFLEDGEEREWSVGCMSWETPESLKNHLTMWKPKAHFISAEIIPDRHLA